MGSCWRARFSHDPALGSQSSRYVLGRKISHHSSSATFHKVQKCKMGYQLLEESDAEENQVQTTSSEYIRYHHLLMLATASLAVNLLFLISIPFSIAYLPSLSRHPFGFSAGTPLGECKIGFSNNCVNTRTNSVPSSIGYLYDNEQ